MTVIYLFEVNLINAQPTNAITTLESFLFILVLFKFNITEKL